eukprot:7345317-Prorocentrum_lima.AAC.1
MSGARSGFTAIPAFCRSVAAAPAIAPSRNCCLTLSTRAYMSCGFGAALTSSIWAPCHRLSHWPPFQSLSRVPM